MAAPYHQQLIKESLAHHRAGRVERAAAGYAQLLAVMPANFEALQLAGALALSRGDPAAAIELLQRALAVQPNSVPCLVRLATALVSLGRLKEAEAAARHAYALDWKSADTHNVLGGVLMRSGKVGEATKVYASLTKLWPQQANGWVALATAQLHLSRPAEAVAACRRALAEDPTHATALFVLGQAQLQRHDVKGALDSFSAQLERNPRHHLGRSFRLFALNYDASVSREQLFAEHQAYGRAVGNSVEAARPAVETAGRRLRLAFLSPDLRRHAVATFIEPLLANLDRSRFEVFLYHDHFAVDAVSLRLQAHGDHWRNFVGQGNAEVAKIVRADAPDVLVDLTGHTHHNRLELLARRLAPVQINYLGYPNTTGIEAMDFRLTDAVCDPVGEADRWHTEALVRFAPTAWAYAPPPEAPEIAPLPNAKGAPFTFGSFNNLSKINTATLSLWKSVLDAVPGSRLLIKGLRLEEEALRARLEQTGLNGERVVCVPPTSTVMEHLATYAQMDVALDPHPYNGTTTTCEALWMGVPVVTLYGDRHASRVSTSLLKAIGHAEWSAASPTDYIRIAAELADDGIKLAAIRVNLRSKMNASALLDHAGQAARFAEAIEQCIGRAATRQRPAA